MARITNYVDGNVLTGAQLNTEIDNIWNNGPSLVSLAIPAYSAVSGLSGSISTAGIGSFSANAYQLKSTSTISSLSATSSYSVNTQTAGPIANGRDQAAVFASTQVHFYAITTGGTSTNAAGICSTRPPNTGPTLPAGYSAWAYLASVTYSTLSSAPVVPTYVLGSQVHFRAPNTGTLCVPLLQGSATVETEVGCGGVVPPIASDFTVDINAGGLTPSSGGSFSASCSFFVEPTVILRSYGLEIPSTAVAGRVRAVMFPLTFPNVRTTPSFTYAHSITVGTSANCTAILVRYTVPNGDVG